MATTLDDIKNVLQAQTGNKALDKQLHELVKLFANFKKSFTVNVHLKDDRQSTLSTSRLSRSIDELTRSTKFGNEALDRQVAALHEFTNTFGKMTGWVTALSKLELLGKPLGFTKDLALLRKSRQGASVASASAVPAPSPLRVASRPAALLPPQVTPRLFPTLASARPPFPTLATSGVPFPTLSNLATSGVPFPTLSNLPTPQRVASAGVPSATVNQRFLHKMRFGEDDTALLKAISSLRSGTHGLGAHAASRTGSQLAPGNLAGDLAQIIHSLRESPHENVRGMIANLRQRLDVVRQTNKGKGAAQAVVAETVSFLNEQIAPFVGGKVEQSRELIEAAMGRSGFSFSGKGQPQPPFPTLTPSARLNPPGKPQPPFPTMVDFSPSTPPGKPQPPFPTLMGFGGGNRPPASTRASGGMSFRGPPPPPAPPGGNPPGPPGTRASGGMGGGGWLMGLIRLGTFVAGGVGKAGGIAGEMAGGVLGAAGVLGGFAGAAALANPAGAALAITGVAVAFATLPFSIKMLGESALEAQRSLSEFSGELAIVFARWDIFTTLNNMKISKAIAPSADLLETQLEILVERLTPTIVALLDSINTGIAGILNVTNLFLAFIEPVMSEIVMHLFILSATARWVMGRPDRPTSSGDATKFLNDMATEYQRRRKDGQILPSTGFRF